MQSCIEWVTPKKETNAMLCWSFNAGRSLKSSTWGHEPRLRNPFTVAARADLWKPLNFSAVYSCVRLFDRVTCYAQSTSYFSLTPTNKRIGNNSCNFVIVLSIFLVIYSKSFRLNRARLLPILSTDQTTFSEDRINGESVEGLWFVSFFRGDGKSSLCILLEFVSCCSPSFCRKTWRVVLYAWFLRDTFNYSAADWKWKLITKVCPHLYLHPVFPVFSW